MPRPTIVKETPTRVETWLGDDQGKPVHRLLVISKTEPRIVTFPVSESAARGIIPKRIKEIELRGWANIAALPQILRRGSAITLAHKRVAPIMRRLYMKYPRLSKLVIARNGKTRLGAETAAFSWADFEALARAVGREIDLFEARRKVAVINGLANRSGAFARAGLALARGGLSQLLEPFGDSIALSQGDTDRVLALISHAALGSVTVTANFIQTKNKVNVAYLETVIAEFEALLAARTDNEKDWQAFFDAHGWILANIFPYQVILHKKEAFVGGKTIENDQGRIVDFLFHNGFRDNYALLEIKTHLTPLLKDAAYREPEAYAAHDKCSGAVAQCLDQKNIFMTDFGQSYRSLDPKVVLIIGNKSALRDNQRPAFELMRANQKNVDIVTFDEVLEKIRGLRSILQEGV